MARALYEGDNLVWLRQHDGASIDLCYIDPPFNSGRNRDGHQSIAFADTWTWNATAEVSITELLQNLGRRHNAQTVALIKGLHESLGRNGMLAYLVALTLRVAEIHRVLKPTGSFYLHCDPTSSHYLKVVIDSVFLPGGGVFQNEVIWHYETGGASKRHFARKHDVLLFYTKSAGYTFNCMAVREPRTEKSLRRAQNPRGARLAVSDTTKLPTDVFHVAALNPMSTERSGYPTQKPEALLQRIILASSNVGDVILDACCGSGTTLVASERLGRSWVGIDVNPQAIAMTLSRLENQFGEALRGEIRRVCLV